LQARITPSFVLESFVYLGDSTSGALKDLLGCAFIGWVQNPIGCFED
jgi:hypothetical protein